MAMLKVPSVRTPLSDGIWLVPVSKALRLGCVLSACSNPVCTCTELSLHVYDLDQRVSGFGLNKSRLLLKSAPLDDHPMELPPPLSLKVDVYTGAVTDAENRAADERDRRVAAIVDALDAETLDELEALWRRQKGLPSRSGEIRADANYGEAGELVYWDEVFEVDRSEGFLDGGHLVVALDMYCVNPECDCHRASVSFCEEILPERAETPAIGMVSVSFDGSVTFEPDTPNAEPRLRALWARYRRRHPELRMLRERYLKIREHAQKRELQRSVEARRTPPISDVAPRADGTSPSGSALASLQPRGSAPRAWVSSSRKRARRGG